jgi:hypothetical protein
VSTLLSSAKEPPVVATPGGPLVVLLEGGRGFSAARDPSALAAALGGALSEAMASRAVAEQPAALADHHLPIKLIGPRDNALYDEAVR